MLNLSNEDNIALNTFGKRVSDIFLMAGGILLVAAAFFSALCVGALIPLKITKRLWLPGFVLYLAGVGGLILEKATEEKATEGRFKRNEKKTLQALEELIRGIEKVKDFTSLQSFDQQNYRVEENQDISEQLRQYIAQEGRIKKISEWIELVIEDSNPLSGPTEDLARINNDAQNFKKKFLAGENISTTTALGCGGVIAGAVAIPYYFTIFLKETGRS